MSDRRRAAQTLHIADLTPIGPKVLPGVIEGPMGTGDVRYQSAVHFPIAPRDLHLSQTQHKVLGRGWATPLDQGGTSLRDKGESRIRQAREPV